jgi:hypothetical protein
MSFDMSDVGPLLTEGQIARIEKQLDVTLPDDYRSFLIRTNGGKPRQDSFPIQTHKTLSIGKIVQLFGLGRPVKESNIDWNYKNLIGQLPNYHFPIAITPEEDMVTLSLGRLDAGRVYYWVRAEYNVAGDNEAYFIAGNFDKFIDLLYAVS